MPSLKFPTFPSVDFSNLDLSKLPKPTLPTVDTDAITAAAKDAAFITIGLAVLAVQKLQQNRRELSKTLNEQFGNTKLQLDDLKETLESRLAELDTRFSAIEGKIDTAVEGLEKRLPERAGAVLGQAHEAAKAARKQVRGLIAAPAA